jgi:O-antigen ligase
VLAVIGMTYLIAAARSMTTRLIYLGAALVVGLLLASRFGALEAGAAARFDKLFNADVSLEERTSGRVNLMRGGLSIFMQHPFGIGTGGFEDAWAALEQPETVTQWAAGKQVPAHSGWLMVLVENGLPGIVLFVIYVASFAFVGVRQRDRRLCLLGLFVTVMLAVAFTMNEFQGKALWFAAAAATALMHPEAIRIGIRPRPRRRAVRSRPLLEPVEADV